VTVPERIGIIGAGVIGGSLARALHAAGSVVHAASPDPSERAALGALGIPAFDADDAGVARAVEGVALAVLAVPIDALAGVADRVLAAARDETLVLHTASLLSQRATRFAASAATRIIGTHPIAGSHGQGFAASDPHCFDGRTVVADDRASPGQREWISAMWRAAGAARITYMNPESHDRAMAWTSHLPQLAASALAYAEAHGRGDASLSGPGLRDTTRLALSPFPLWRAILDVAPSETLAAVRAFEMSVRDLREFLERRDAAALETLWDEARRWRSTVPQ
jgi:prephenate dehydrogenase